jgi:hypothetical protein
MTNRINDYIRKLNDYKEDLDTFEKMAKLLNFDQQIPSISSGQNDIQKIIEALENERARMTSVNPVFITAFLTDKKIKLNDEFIEIQRDIDKLA